MHIHQDVLSRPLSHNTTEYLLPNAVRTIHPCFGCSCYRVRGNLRSAIGWHRHRLSDWATLIESATPARSFCSHVALTVDLLSHQGSSKSSCTHCTPGCLWGSRAKRHAHRQTEPTTIPLLHSVDLAYWAAVQSTHASSKFQVSITLTISCYWSKLLQ